MFIDEGFENFAVVLPGQLLTKNKKLPVLPKRFFILVSRAGLRQIALQFVTSKANQQMSYFFQKKYDMWSPLGLKAEAPSPFEKTPIHPRTETRGFLHGD